MRRWLRLVVLLAVVAAASAWASGWQRDTWGARLGTFGWGLVVLGLGFVSQRRSALSGSSIVVRPTAWAAAQDPAVRRRGASVWLTIFVVAAAWDVLGLLTPADQHHLTLSAMALAYQPLHALLFAYWLAAGFLLTRAPLRR